MGFRHRRKLVGDIISPLAPTPFSSFGSHRRYHSLPDEATGYTLLESETTGHKPLERETTGYKPLERETPGYEPS